MSPIAIAKPCANYLLVQRAARNDGYLKEFLIIGIGQGILLSAILLLRDRFSHNHSRYLGIFVLAITGIIAGPLLNEYVSPEAGLMVDPLVFLIGPSIYLFIVSFTQKITWKDHLVHAVPFLVYIPVLLLFYVIFLQPRLAGFTTENVYSSAFAILIATAKFSHLLFYGFLSFRALRRHRQTVESEFANVTGKDLQWLRFLLWGFLVLVVVSIVLYVAAMRFPAHLHELTLFNLSLFSVFLYLITFFFYGQKNVFDKKILPVATEAPEEKEEDSSAPKYEKSGLKPAEIEALKQRVEAFLTVENFTNPDLSLQQMADELKTQPHKLSELLNKHLQVSFYDLINQRRVAHIQALMKDPANDHFTILGLAYANGFNSKSSFNSAFKKFTGSTPSAFKQINR